MPTHGQQCYSTEDIESRDDLTVSSYSHIQFNDVLSHQSDCKSCHFMCQHGAPMFSIGVCLLLSAAVLIVQPVQSLLVLLLMSEMFWQRLTMLVYRFVDDFLCRSGRRR